ncbi:MAG: cell division protein FtsX, partial [Acidobacteriota bacterium]
GNRMLRRDRAGRCGHPIGEEPMTDLVLRRASICFRMVVEGVRANPVGSAVAVLASALCLIFLGACLFAPGGLRPGGGSPRDSRIAAYFNPQIAAEELENLARKAGEWPEVARVTVVSREEALKRFASRLGELKGVLDGIDDNPLPPSLEIELKPGGLDKAGGVVEKLRQFPQVEEIFPGKSGVEGLESLTGIIRHAILWTATLLACLAAAISYMAARVNVMARRDEFELYDLLGATPLFSRLPLYVEAVLQGAASGVLAAAALASLAFAARENLPLSVASAFSLGGLELSALVAAGIFLSGSGFWLALRRHT